MIQSEPIRIFVDCHVFDGTFQGTTTYLRGIYTEMIKEEGIEFYFAASDTSHLKNIFGTAANIHYLQYRNHNKFYRLLVDIPGMIKRHNIDYAHFQYIVPPIKYCRYIVTLHDVIFMEYPEYFPSVYRLKNGFLFKACAKKADILLTISEYSRGQIKKHFGLDSHGITVNTADDVFFEPYNKAEVQQQVKQKFGVSDYWLFVSRREPRKNHHGLLKAFYEGGFYKQYSLVLVGDDAIKNEEYETLYASLPDEVKQKVSSFRKVGFTDMLLLLRGASLSVYPSIAEGFGIPPLEAAAAGIPVACSGTTSMSDFTFFGNALFDPYSTADMIEKIQYALTHPNPTLSKQVREKYSWAQAAQVVLKLVRQGGKTN